VLCVLPAPQPFRKEAASLQIREIDLQQIEGAAFILNWAAILPPAQQLLLGHFPV